MSKFTKRPLIHMGTIMTHLLWPSFARSSTAAPTSGVNRINDSK